MMLLANVLLLATVVSWALVILYWLIVFPVIEVRLKEITERQALAIIAEVAELRGKRWPITTKQAADEQAAFWLLDWLSGRVKLRHGMRNRGEGIRKLLASLKPGRGREPIGIALISALAICAARAPGVVFALLAYMLVHATGSVLNPRRFIAAAHEIVIAKARELGLMLREPLPV